MCGHIAAHKSTRHHKRRGEYRRAKNPSRGKTSTEAARPSHGESMPPWPRGCPIYSRAQKEKSESCAVPSGPKMDTETDVVLATLTRFLGQALETRTAGRAAK